MVEAGVEAKEKALAEARHKLAVVDDTVEKKHGLLRKLDDERNALVAGDTNPAYNEALETIAVGRQQGRPGHPLPGGAPHADERR